MFCKKHIICSTYCYLFIQCYLFKLHIFRHNPKIENSSMQLFIAALHRKWPWSIKRILRTLANKNWCKPQKFFSSSWNRDAKTKIPWAILKFAEEQGVQNCVLHKSKCAKFLWNVLIMSLGIKNIYLLDLINNNFLKNSILNFFRIVSF